jgi:hypothetical protein
LKLYTHQPIPRGPSRHRIMARKSKDPRKPSQAFLRETGQATSNANEDAATTEPVEAPATSEEAEILRRAIKDLGGDDSDYELLKGLSSDEEEEVVEAKPKAKKNQKGQVDEVCSWLLLRSTHETCN